jgi:hypothetical protein
LAVGAGSAVAAGLPGHHYRMHCGVVREVTFAPYNSLRCGCSDN